MLILDTGIREELKIVEKDLAEYLRAEGNASQVGDILRDVSLSIYTIIPVRKNWRGWLFCLSMSGTITSQE